MGSWFWIAVVVAVFAGCAADDGGGGPGDVDAGAGLEDTLNTQELELFDAINAERATMGLSALALRETLLCAARAHSGDVGPAGLCSHTGTDSSDPTMRVERCGGTATGWSGELIACGPTTAQFAVGGWAVDPANSPHLFSPTNTHVGVGMDSNYWTAVFDN